MKFDNIGGFVFLALGLLLLFYVIDLTGVTSNRVFSFVILLSPIWLPIVTFLVFYEKWLEFVRKEFNLKNGRTTLEIRLPQEVLKSPLAMELVFNQLYQTASADNLVQTYWDGKHPPKFSLEVASTGGAVRFLINTPTNKFKNFIESQLYAQYPGIEVTELPVDYTAEIPYDPDKYSYFSFHYTLRKADAYPIKTYVDFDLDKNPKEEEKVDPITVMLELMGSLKPKEHAWIQIMITANKKQDFKTGSLRKKPDWKDDVKAEIENIIAGAAKRRSEEGGGAQQLTDGERDTIKSLERSVSKYAFNTTIRSMYIAENGHFDGGRLGALAGIFRQYDDISRNQLGVIWRTDTDWPWWQDIGGRKTKMWKKEELKDYKKRSYTNWATSDGGMILTTEELATIFHPPGQVALTPTLGRIPSARSEAPSNLPIELPTE